MLSVVYCPRVRVRDSVGPDMRMRVPTLFLLRFIVINQSLWLTATQRKETEGGEQGKKSHRQPKDPMVTHLITDQNKKGKRKQRGTVSLIDTESLVVLKNSSFNIFFRNTGF